MTTYTITTKTDTKGNTGALSIGVETAVFDLTAQSADYLFEGYIDLNPMQAGDTTVVTEYISADGTNLRVYNQATFSGVQSAPLIRFHGKLLEKDMLYRVTLNQTAGVGRDYYYASVLQVFNA